MLISHPIVPGQVHENVDDESAQKASVQMKEDGDNDPTAVSEIIVFQIVPPLEPVTETVDVLTLIGDSEKPEVELRLRGEVQSSGK